MMTEKELAEYYDTHSFAENFIEAKKNGDLIICRPRENVIEAAKRHRAEKAARLAATPAFAAKTVSPRRRVAAVAAL